MRALERPPAADAVLEYLQREAVIVVSGTRVDLQEPLAVGRHVGDRLPRQALEVLAHDRDALGGAVRLFVMDSPDPRIDLLEHVVADARGLDTWARAKSARCRRWDAVARFPAQQRAGARVLLEQGAEESRSRSEHADPDQRGGNTLSSHVGMASP